jgi:hypothetical protein
MCILYIYIMVLPVAKKHLVWSFDLFVRLLHSVILLVFLIADVKLSPPPTQTMKREEQ